MINLKEKFKVSLATKILEKQKKKNPFNITESEFFSLPDNPVPSLNNSYYFSCHDQKGYSLIFRLGIRGGGTNELWFAVKDGEGNIYYNEDQLISKSNPHTGTAGSEMIAEAGVDCIEAGRKWRFSFKGKAIKAIPDNNLAAVNSGKEADIFFEGIFTSSNNIFEFSRDMDTAPIARAIAREKWTKSFLKEIRENHQIHYEQPGHVTGIIEINGHKTEISLPAMRDHSYGKRDWSYMSRHIWIMILMESGQYLNINMVSYPALKELQSGYLINGRNKIKPICIDHFTQIAELKTIDIVPRNFNFKAYMTDGRIFDVACRKEIEFVFPFDDGAYTIHEGAGSFVCNGTKGRGIIEFGFNKDKSRWI